MTFGISPKGPAAKVRLDFGDVTIRFGGGIDWSGERRIGVLIKARW